MRNALVSRLTQFEARSAQARKFDELRKAKARYDASQYSPNRSRRFTPTQDVRFDARASDRLTIAGKARDFEANSWIAQAIGSVWTDFTVGATGLMLTPASSDSEWNKKAKAYWEQTAQFLNLQTRASFGMDQALCSWRWLFDGEIFIYKTRAQARNGRWFPRIKLLETHLVGTPPSLAKEEGKTIFDGVQIDSDGRPSGYWVRTGIEPDAWTLVDAKNIIHIFEPSRVCQYRGISFFHAVMNLLHDVDDFMRFEMQAAKANAYVARFVKTATGEIADEDLVRSGGTLPDSDGVKRPQYEEEIFGAEIKALFPGDEVMQFGGERPSVITREYWNLIIGAICKGVGIPLQMILPYSIQGTMGRADLEIATAFFRARTCTLATAFREVYLYVLGWGNQTEILLADPPADWWKVSIRPPRAPNVDVGRNASADALALANGSTNYELLYGPLGLDWREEFDKLAEQQKYAADIGLVLREAPALGQPQPDADPILTA